MLQAFTCEACGSLRPSSSSAAAQDDRPTTSAAGHDDARQEADKGKKKGKTAKFERLRITGKQHVYICSNQSDLMPLDRIRLLGVVHASMQLQVHRHSAFKSH